MANKVGALINGDVTLPDGSVIRLYGNGAIWSNAIMGQFWLQKIGDPAYFTGPPRVMTFSGAKAAHIECDGLYNNRPARLILDLTDKPDTVSFTLLQSNATVFALTDAQPIKQSETDPAEKSEYVTLFAP